MLRRIHLRQDARIVAAHFVDQRDSKVQTGLVVRLDDFAADRFEGQLALAHREYARPHDQDDGHDGQQDIEQPVLHQRDPRARAGSSIGVTWISGSRGGATVMVSLGLEMDCGPAEISFSSGRYIMLLPPLVSTMTLREFL
jgi:hypothetical protein